VLSTLRIIKISKMKQRTKLKGKIKSFAMDYAKFTYFSFEQILNKYYNVN